MRFVDANIFIRAITQDDPVKANACTAHFASLRAGHEQATTNEGVVAEVVYVLNSPNLYALPRHEIRDAVSTLLRVRGLRLPDKAGVIDALGMYAERSHLSFADALSVAHMRRHNITEILSYDTDFDRIEGITRVEP